MNRGDRCEALFLDEADRRSFLETLAAACGKSSWEIHAYCLMGNHFQLVEQRRFQADFRRAAGARSSWRGGCAGKRRCV